jgi:hypothetical protein
VKAPDSASRISAGMRCKSVETRRQPLASSIIFSDTFIARAHNRPEKDTT